MLFSAVPGALFVCIHVSRKEANDHTSPMMLRHVGPMERNNYHSIR